MEPVLRVRNITAVFGRPGQAERRAVDNVSFDLFPGECLGIIGESGSGKTTLVNVITRLAEPSGGCIFLNGAEITKLRGRKLKEIYRDMQMVFQHPAESFDPRRTLGDGIGESLLNAGMSRAAVKAEVGRLAAECGLSPDLAGRYPHEVSGGECQRAAIARALAIKPKVLICDEATSALDVTVQQEIMELLKRLRALRGRELSILFISHDLALVQEFCDRVLVMDEGRIAEEGTPDEIINNPQAECTKKLIESIL